MTLGNQNLNPERFFSSNSSQRALAIEIFQSIENLPIVSPHGHINIDLFLDNQRSLGNPVDLFVRSDHYVFRMLHSYGVSLDTIGLTNDPNQFQQIDPRKVWQVFCDNYFLFTGTPTGAWIDYVLDKVFGIQQNISGKIAQSIYDSLLEKINSDEFTPRNLYKKFNIEILSTTDSPIDNLAKHISIRNSGWDGVIIPTFRPDGLLNIQDPNWRSMVEHLETMVGYNIDTFSKFLCALFERRKFFKNLGATSTDHGIFSPFVGIIPQHKLNTIFQKALLHKVTPSESKNFSSYMLYEMAKMSTEDGMVMQFHPGSFRNHNTEIYTRYGPDKGFDIPIPVEFTQNLRPLLESFGNHSEFSCILFILDESTYTRELAPLAGVYPSVKLGPPWWFLDSPNGIRRYLDYVMETAGIWNTTGFVDDTRSFPSIPARHDVWRRICADWLAGMVAQHRIGLEEAHLLGNLIAVELARKAYKFEAKHAQK